MDNESENLLSQRSIQEMVMVANEFCHFIENAENQSVEIILSVLQKMMPLMYLKGSLLPTIEVKNEDALTFFVTEEDWTNIYSMLKKKLQMDDLFLFVEDDADKDEVPSQKSISEDLADVYQDLKDCLQLLKLNTKDAQENSISELQKLFISHWGIRVCRLQYAIHFIRNNHKKV